MEDALQERDPLLNRVRILVPHPVDEVMYYVSRATRRPFHEETRLVKPHYTRNTLHIV